LGKEAVGNERVDIAFAQLDFEDAKAPLPTLA
jgi:hypothetical protein